MQFNKEILVTVYCPFVLAVEQYLLFNSLALIQDYIICIKVVHGYLLELSDRCKVTNNRFILTYCFY